MKFFKIWVLCVLLILVTGCSKEVAKIEEDVYGNKDKNKKSELTLPLETYRVYDVNDSISVVHGETGSIYVKDNGEYTEVNKILGSYPETAPNKTALVFVTGEADQPGELYLYTFKDKEKIMLMDNDEGKNTPKAVKWLDNKRLIIIRGFGHGRVKLGGEVCVYHIETEKITPILVPDKMSEYRTIAKNGDTFEFELATWEDESYNTTKSQIVTYKTSELKKML